MAITSVRGSPTKHSLATTLPSTSDGTAVRAASQICSRDVAATMSAAADASTRSRAM
jgi:hypothetical protein